MLIIHSRTYKVVIARVSKAFKCIVDTVNLISRLKDQAVSSEK